MSVNCPLTKRRRSAPAWGYAYPVAGARCILMRGAARLQGRAFCSPGVLPFLVPLQYVWDGAGTLFFPVPGLWAMPVRTVSVPWSGYRPGPLGCRQSTHRHDPQVLTPSLRPPTTMRRWRQARCTPVLGPGVAVLGRLTLGPCWPGTRSSTDRGHYPLVRPYSGSWRGG